MWDGFMIYLEVLKTFYIDLPIAIIGWLADAVTWLVSRGVEVITGFVTGLWNAYVDIANFFGEIPGRLIGLIADAASWLVGRGMETIRGLFQGMRQVWDMEVSFITGIRDRILNAISGAATWLYNIGRDIVQGLINGIWSKFGELADAVSSIAGKVTGGVGGLLHLGSPSKVMQQYGEWTVEGFEIGLRRTAAGLDLGALMGIDQFTAPTFPNMTVSTTAPEPGSVAGTGGPLVGSLVINEANTPAGQTLGDLEWAIRTSGRN
jgi:phage-related protein